MLGLATVCRFAGTRNIGAYGASFLAVRKALGALSMPPLKYRTRENTIGHHDQHRWH